MWAPSRVPPDPGPVNPARSNWAAPPDPRDGLAARAEERRAVHERDPPDRGAAAVAGQPLAAVGVQRPVEVAGLAVDVDVERVERRPAVDRGQPSSPRATGRAPTLTCGRVSPGARPVTVHLRAPQRLVGVDVADARDEGLVEELALDARRTPAHPRHERGVVELRVERVAGDVGDLRRQLARRRSRRAARRTSAGRRSASPGSARPGPSRDEPHPQVPLVGCARVLEQHLAAHPEVAEQRVVVVEGEPQVLAAAPGGLDPAPHESGDEARRAARVAAHRPRMQHLDRADGARRGRAGPGRRGRPRPREARARAGRAYVGASSAARRQRGRTSPC